MMSFKNSVDNEWKEEDGKLLPIWSCCPLPGMYSNLMWNALAQLVFKFKHSASIWNAWSKYLSTSLHFAKLRHFLRHWWFMAKIYVVPYSESMHTTYVKIGPSHQKIWRAKERAYAGGAQSYILYTFTAGLGRMPLHVSWRKQDIE